MGVVEPRQSRAHWFTPAHGSLPAEPEGNVGREDVKGSQEHNILGYKQDHILSHYLVERNVIRADSGSYRECGPQNWHLKRSGTIRQPLNFIQFNKS